MQVDVTQEVIGLEGEPFLTSPKVVQLEDGRIIENPDSKPLTLRKALVAALNHSAEKLSLGKQQARYRLAKRISKMDAPDLTAAQITNLKRVCAEKWAPLLTGAIADLLEPAQSDAAPTDEDL